MGKISSCDDAKTGTEIDWDPRDFIQFTCPNEFTFPVQRSLEPESFDTRSKNSSFDPRKDVVTHKCINEKIEYGDNPPLRGDHRPNWARYGEYLFVPVQRWLHNLEHGTVVLLYHPCADQEELSRLREIVTSCLYRHVITPYMNLSEQRPLALLTWGAKLEMSVVDETLAVNFIREHARVAPEDIARDGLYVKYLINPAKIVSDQMDGNICPNHPKSA